MHFNFFAYTGWLNADTGDVQVKRTMKHIREVLRDRQLAYEEARILQSQDDIENLLNRGEKVMEDYTYGDLLEEPPRTETASESSETSTTSPPPEDARPHERVIGPRPTN